MPEEKIWKQVTIIGCGLIGSSFALALRNANLSDHISGWDAAPQVLDDALRLGVIDQVDQAIASDSVSSADLVFLAMPVQAIIEFLRDRGHQTKPGALVTDAGSTKVQICRAAAAFLSPGQLFIGGHPVCGSHLGGLENSHASVFENATYVLTSDCTTQTHPAFVALSETVRRIGASPVVMDAAEHDNAMAFVSHLPQLLSSVLASTISQQTHHNEMLKIAGTGYRDMTRLATSPWSIWRDILATNSAQISVAIDQYVAKLCAVSAELKRLDPTPDDELRFAQSLFDCASRR
jgi:prephenate dehydrogenase